MYKNPIIYEISITREKCDNNSSTLWFSARIMTVMTLNAKLPLGRVLIIGNGIKYVMVVVIKLLKDTIYKYLI